MLLMVLRKMYANIWLVLCLLVGIVIAVAMVSTIPIYTHGVLTRMLIKDLEDFQIDRGYYPGRLSVKMDISPNYTEDLENRLYKSLDSEIRETVPRDLGLPVMSFAPMVTKDYMTILPEVPKVDEPREKYIKIEAIENIYDHIELTHGRLPSNQAGGNVIEAMVTLQAFNEIELVMDENYVIADMIVKDYQGPMIKVVGIFTVKDEVDTFWWTGLWAFNETFMIDFDLFQEVFVNTGSPSPFKSQWHYAFDYHEITTDHVSRILDVHERQVRATKPLRIVDIRLAALDILEHYEIRENQLRITLWVLQVPILLMLVFYLFMVSGLIIEHEKNEIAVIKSRGGSGSQIFLSYLVESVILSFVALILGPPLGLAMCTMLGAANGFLEFVQRTALPVVLTPKAYFYSLIAIVMSIVSMLVPAFIASRTTIVQHKQRVSRSGKQTLWKRYFIDILLLLIAGYGYYQYQLRQQTLLITGATGTDIAIDPLLFLISTIFTLGTGFLFLRIFPLLIRSVFWAGRNRWNPVLYASFVQVGRSSGRDQFLMLFLILSLSMGVFNADSARTLNSNLEEKAFYAIGADVTMEEEWTKVDASGYAIAEEEADPFAAAVSSFGSSQAVRYIEPPFKPYTELEGIESATKVFRRDNVKTRTVTGEYITGVNIMGIISHEFGGVAWFRDDLLPYHWYQYLNLLTLNPAATIVSTAFATDHGVQVGDTLRVSWGSQQDMEVVVFGFIDYWPTHNPNELVNNRQSKLIVANLPFIQAMNAIEPYEVWMKKKPGVTSEEIYEQLEEKRLDILNLEDARQKVIKNKNDPMMQGTNGALTLGFLVTLTISIIGFLIFWILSIQERILQFGIFRAMGMSMRRIIGLLVSEQVMISGTAVVAGVSVGRITSKLFVPLMQVIYSAAQQIPPFRVVSYLSDYAKIYLAVAVMLGAGLITLGMIVKNINISQAIKLGED
jgi:putative ABC transport system permease protein